MKALLPNFTPGFRILHTGPGKKTPCMEKEMWHGHAPSREKETRRKKTRHASPREKRDIENAKKKRAGKKRVMHRPGKNAT
jgi:hypothetical protein